MSFFTSSTPTLGPNFPKQKELLERLINLSASEGLLSKKQHEIVLDILTMFGKALAEAEKPGGSVENDGVAVRTFIPLMTQIVILTMECLESRSPCSSSSKRFSLLRNRKSEPFQVELGSLRNKLQGFYFLAMPCAPPGEISRRKEDVLVLAANIGSVVSTVCDGVPVLGILKPVAGIITGVCNTIQVNRNNHRIMEEILQMVRDEFRMVVRKVQGSEPSTLMNTEFRRDVEDYFRNLEKIIYSTLKFRGSSTMRSMFAQKDRDDLQELRSRIQEARNKFSNRLTVSNNMMTISISTRLQQAIVYHQERTSEYPVALQTHPSSTELVLSPETQQEQTSEYPVALNSPKESGLSQMQVSTKRLILKYRGELFPS